MRTLEETRLRWEATISKCGSLAELQQAVKSNGSSSLCLSGCRSLCWKIFLVFNTTDSERWSTTLAETRKKYEESRTRFLQYIKHPEALAEVASDPLADDPESPWTAVRQDEAIRAEIEQDVQRLPGDANYHDPQIQQIVLDVLFVYCKLHPERGGYRQGMHEILAPIVHVLEQDAVARSPTTDNTLDLPMLDMLDTKYLEHDAYTLFSHLMEHAKSFYEVVEANNAAENSSMQGQSSTIVERSRQIHEVYLHKIDPDLAVHLKNIEILPQIFLIRWIRLLYNREFPFTQFLVLWDTIFAVDPTLSLIDLISCAMILRIRWQLLEGDYSVCLHHLLKYPAPDAAHGPHTFVDDALYLKQNLDFTGGSHLIMKYSSRMPEPPGSVSSVVNSPHSALKHERVNKASLPSPTKFIQQQQGNVENFLQGAAKSAKDVLERGERLGLNQAVRDAMGELRRNMQSLNESRSLNRGSLGGEAAKTLALMEARNKQLAILLEETVANLKTAAASGLEDKVKSLELIEIAAAKAQFVQIYLQDVSMEVPSYGAAKGNKQATPAQPESPAASTASAKPAIPKPLPPTPQKSAPAPSPAPTATVPIRSTKPSTPNTAPVLTKPAAAEANPQTDASVPNPGPAASQQQQQQQQLAPGPAETKPEEAKTPTPSVPKRSTIAQSSFSWMLEPDEPASPKSPVNSVKSPTFPSKSNRRSGNLSRDKNSFLFGDGDEANSSDPLGSNSEGIFGMESMPKPKK